MAVMHFGLIFSIGLILFLAGIFSSKPDKEDDDEEAALTAYGSEESE